MKRTSRGNRWRAWWGWSLARMRWGQGHGCFDSERGGGHSEPTQPSTVSAESVLGTPAHRELWVLAQSHGWPGLSWAGSLADWPDPHALFFLFRNTLLRLVLARTFCTHLKCTVRSHSHMHAHETLSPAIKIEPVTHKFSRVSLFLNSCTFYY